MCDCPDGGLLDPRTWNVLTPSPGTSFTVAETNQRLEVTLGAGFGGAGIVTTCQFTSDFDLQVDYLLLNWPADNLHSIRLGAPDLGVGAGGGIGLNRSSFSNGGTGEFYLISLPNSDPQIPAGQNFGKLRLVRSGSTMSGFILDGNATTWTLVGSGPISTAATHISLDLGAGSSSAQGGVSVAFDNFQTNSGTVACPSSQQRAVVVIPGIMGSVLRRADNQDLVWIDSIDALLSFCDEQLLPLALEKDGATPAGPFQFTCTSTPSPQQVSAAGALIKPTELLVGNTGPDTDIYKSLLQSLSGVTAQVQPFPYDWRLDYLTIAQQLRSTITQLAPTSADSVDIVAHSQGGLVARTYFQLYPSDTRVHSVIYLGTPHLGATKSYAALTGWQDFGKYYGPLFPSSVLNFDTMVFLGSNFPALYELLPRYDFFSIDGTLQAFRITESTLRNVPLAGQANTLWDLVLRNTNPVPHSFAINGAAQNTLRYLIKDSHLDCLIPLNDATGDGTVPSASAQALPGTEYFYVGVEHAHLPNDSTVDQMISGILLNGAPPPG